MHLGMCWLWPESGHWVEILRQHPPMTAAIAEALDAHLLRGSQSSPPHRGGLPCPPHQDPGSSSLSLTGVGKCRCRFAKCPLCGECGSFQTRSIGDHLCWWIHYRVSCSPNRAGLILNRNGDCTV